MVLFDETNDTKISIALSVVAIFSIFLIINYLEHNLAFGSFHENPIVTIGLDSEFLTYDDLITGFSIKYPQDWERAQHLDKSVTFLAPTESTSNTNPAGLGIMVIYIEESISGHSNSGIYGNHIPGTSFAYDYFYSYR